MVYMEGKRKEMEMRDIPISEKYMLTVKEAAAYFNIGIKKMRRLAEDNVLAGNKMERFAVYSGNRYLIIRPRFEEFVGKSLEI